MVMSPDELESEASLYRKRNFSQFGEDAVLEWLFPEKRNGFYVDVGCHFPFRISNTAFLHIERGWHGLNIDVDQRAIDAFNRVRPNDINICTGVAGVPGQMEVTIFDEGAINTFNEASAAHPAWAHINRVKKTVQVDTLASLLSRNLPTDQNIDLFNLDAEGLDFEILSSNDWDKFKPQIIMVEAEGLDLENLGGSKTFVFLRNLGYKIVSHTAITSFYRRI